MRPSTIWYTLKQGIKNIKRNFMFSIASIITMAACIFLFGIFFSIVNNVNTLAHKVEEDVPITVLFNEGTTQEQMDAVGELIRQRPEVSKIEFESGDEAWEKMKQEYFGDDSEAADGFKDDNPLANSSNYRVYMNNIEKQSELVAYIKTLDNVREVNQSEQADHILWLRHNADKAVVTLGVSADRTQFLIGQVLADRAETDAVLRVQNGLCKALRLVLRQRQHIKCQTLRRLHTDAGQTRKLFGQPLECGGERAH